MSDNQVLVKNYVKGKAVLEEVGCDWPVVELSDKITSSS